MRRPGFLLALAIQLCCAVTPADAFLVCVSDDGCVELELAMPGTERCVEVACDSEHAAAAPHGCRDIPLLAHAFAAGSAGGADLPGPTPALLPVGPLLPGPAASSGVRPHAAHPPPPRVAPHRVVVLQL